MRNLSAERRAAAGAGERTETRAGLVFSGLLHLAAIVTLALGGQIFSGGEARAIRLAEVDIVSAASFDAMISTAPEPAAAAIPGLAPPRLDEPQAPQTPATDDRPERADAAEAAAPTREAAP
ncbi:MAG: hypothetical protein AAF192_17340, partial [Pseudomonadota bacterium]